MIAFDRAYLFVCIVRMCECFFMFMVVGFWWPRLLCQADIVSPKSSNGCPYKRHRTKLILRAVCRAPRTSSSIAGDTTSHRRPYMHLENINKSGLLAGQVQSFTFLHTSSQNMPKSSIDDANRCARHFSPSSSAPRRQARAPLHSRPRQSRDESAARRERAPT